MIVRTLAAAVLVVALSTPAFAFKCPSLVNKIDLSLAGGPDLTSEELAKVKKLRDEGEDLHNTGKHGKSVATLNEALDILGAESSKGYTY
ncbi:MAG: hypothetical protein ACE5LL_08000 [Alphaproteobacteria bacterium]